jgi:predicted nucleotidyltransferase
VKYIKHSLPRSYKAVLFGSWANGTATKTSDVDIGIVGPHPIPLSLMYKIRENMESIPTLRKIELVDLQRTSKSFKKKILKYAHIL